jgi:hypothetical protein
MLQERDLVYDHAYQPDSRTKYFQIITLLIIITVKTPADASLKGEFINGIKNKKSICHKG